MASINTRQTTRGPRYDVRYRLADGQYRSKSFARHEDAVSFRKKVERDENAGLVPDHRAGTVTFKAFAEDWMATRIVKGRSLRPSTVQGYRGLLKRHLYPAFKDTPLRAITTEAVRKWHAALALGAGADQAAKSYTLLRAVLNTAVADEKIARNPCQVKGAGVQNPDERPLVPTEMVLDLADAVGERYRALVLLAGIGGLRTGEMLGLRRCDVDLLHRTVTVAQQAQELAGQGRVVLSHTKSDAGRRRVALPGPAVEVLAVQLERFAEPGPEGAVFTGPQGTPLRRATLSAAWRAACRRVGAPAGLHVHDCRHHALTSVARMPGVTLKELMARAGHSTARAALIYQHATEERDRQMADFLETHLSRIDRVPLAPVADIACETDAKVGRSPRRRQLKKGA